MQRYVFFCILMQKNTLLAFFCTHFRLNLITKDASKLSSEQKTYKPQNLQNPAMTLLLLFIAMMMQAQQHLITGAIIDKGTNDPVEASTVQLLRADSTYISGAISDEDGSHQFSGSRRRQLSAQDNQRRIQTHRKAHHDDPGQRPRHGQDKHQRRGHHAQGHHRHGQGQEGGAQGRHLRV